MVVLLGGANVPKRQHRHVIRYMQLDVVVHAVVLVLQRPPKSERTRSTTRLDAFQPAECFRLGMHEQNAVANTCCSGVGFLVDGNDELDKAETPPTCAV